MKIVIYSADLNQSKYSNELNIIKSNLNISKKCSQKSHSLSEILRKKMPMKYKKHEMKESILPKVNCQLIVLLRSTQKEFHRESTV